MEQSLKGKHIVLGITGSIAAYKSCIIIREFVKRGAEVQVVITPAGKEFITPITLSALSSNPVISEFFAQRDGTWHSHVALGLWADAMLIAPATASTIGKMAHGVADNMLITTYLSMKAPVFVAPAMDLDMYAHPTTQENLHTLQRHGVTVIEPGTGFLASHLEGKGRMQEPEQIVATIKKILKEKSDKSDFSERSEHTESSESTADTACPSVLITAGPTYERIDPVRFIGNYSSGKMGLALVDECLRRGMQVQLVLGPISQPVTEQPGLSITRVESAAQMYDAATAIFPSVDAAILCAAVADFTPETAAEQKIKRQGDRMTLQLRPTRDIAAALGRMKRPDQTLAGFALETNDEQTNAERKLEKKNLDFIVLNSLRDAGAGFRTDTNKVTIIRRDGTADQFPLKHKTEVAADIIDQLQASMRPTS